MKAKDFLNRLDTSLGVEPSMEKPKIPNLMAFLEAQKGLTTPVTKEQSVEDMAEEVAAPQLDPKKLAFLKRGRSAR